LTPKELESLVANLIVARDALDRAIGLFHDKAQAEELRELAEDSGRAPCDGAECVLFPPQPALRKAEDALADHSLDDDGTCKSCGKHRRELQLKWVNQGIKLPCRNGENP
jgi:hypothetical protein